MAIHGMEGAVVAARDYLAATMPAKITALNAAYADAIVLAGIVAFEMDERIEVGAYPIVEVLGDEQHARGEDGTSLLGLYDVAIVCLVQDDSGGANLRRRVYRYGRAITELLKSSVAMPAGLGYGVNWGDPMVDYSPAFRQRGSSTVIAGCQVNVRLFKKELH